MCKDRKYFKILHHGNLTKIFPQVYSIKGTMKIFGLFQYSRNMTILHSNGSVILVNPVRVNEDVEKEILALGSIDHILKIGSLHSVDIPYYKDKFNPKLWTLPDDHSLPDYRSDETLTHGMQLPFLDIKVHAFEGSKIPESILFLPSQGGLLISCDSLVNMKSEDSHSNTLVRVLSKLLPKPTYIGPNWVKFAKPYKKSFTSLMAYNFKHLVSAHGDPIIDNARTELSEYFSNYSKWRA